MPVEFGRRAGTGCFSEGFMSRWIFVLQMTLEMTLEVSAANVASVIAAATQALPHLDTTECQRSQAMHSIAYTLTCLLCGQVNPKLSGRTPLIAMQEHVMSEHGLTLEELLDVTRVFQGTPLADCYVWGNPALGACFRATRYATESTSAISYTRHFFSAENLPEQLRFTQALSLRPLDGSPGVLHVQLAG